MAGNELNGRPIEWRTGMKSWLRHNKHSSILHAVLFGFVLLSIPAGSAISLVRSAQAADGTPAATDKSATEPTSNDGAKSDSEDSTPTAGNRTKSPEEKAADRKAEEEDFQF